MGNTAVGFSKLQVGGGGASLVINLFRILDFFLSWVFLGYNNPSIMVLYSS